MLKLSEKLKKKINKYSAATLFLVVVLLPKFPLFNIPRTYVAVRAEDLLLFTAVLVWLLVNVKKLKKMILGKVGVSFLLFWGVGLLSLISAILVTKTVVPHIGLFHWVRRIEYMSAFFIGLSAIGDKKDINFYLKLMIIALVLIFIYGAGQKHLGWPIVTTQNEEYSKGVALRYLPGGHIPATFAGHYDLASFLVLVFPVLFSLTLFKPQTKNTLIYKGVILTVIGFAFWLLVNSVSRISFVTYMLGVSLMFFLVNRTKLIPVVIILSIILGGFSTSLIERYRRVIKVAVEKITYQVSLDVYAGGTPEPAAPAMIFEDRSTSIRLNVEWPRSLRAWSKNPLLGTGYSSISLATDNDYLRSLGETGIFGFLAFMSLILNVLGGLAANFKQGRNSVEKLFLVGLFSGIVAALTNALFIDIFEASKFAIIFWLLVGLAYGVINKNNEAV